MKIKLGLVIMFVILIAPVGLAQESEINDTTKMIIVKTNLINTEDNRILAEKGINISYGQPSIKIVDWEDFNINVLSSTGETIESFSVADPSIIYSVEEDHGVEFLNEADFDLVFLFQRNTKSVDIRDGFSDELLLSVDLADALRSFCSTIEYKNDPECSSIMQAPTIIKKEPSNTGLDPMVIMIIAVIVIIAAIYMKKREK